MFKLKYILLLLLSGMCMFSCQRDEVSPSNSNQLHKKGTEYIWNVPSVFELRGVSYDLSPDRYLGYGFNLVKYPPYESQGFSNYSVLSTTQTPWSPFGRNIEEEDLIPIISQYGSPETLEETHESLTDKSEIDSIVFSISAKYKTHSLSYTTQDVSRQTSKTHTYGSFIYRKEKSVLYDLIDPLNLEFYLHKRFVKDLGRLSAEQLIEKYGTHIVTNYFIGPYMRLSVSANAKVFTKEDVKKMEAKLWDSKFSLTYDQQKKIENNTNSISISYKQGGSDYSPDRSILSLSNFYKNATLYTLDRKAWEEGIRKDNTFLMLGKSGLVSIPDLISDIPLKVKYISGILMETRPSKQSVINYILCNPSSYEPFKLKGKYVRLALKSYGDAVGRLRLGLDASKVLQETDFTGVGVKEHEWTYELQTNGLWTIKSRVSGRYLCTDAQMREENEDTKDLRFWLLNPIVPTPNGNSRSISQLLIKINK